MKKNILYFVFICLIVFEVYCEKLTDIKYANNYNVSEHNIENILGTYMEKDRKGFLFWVETEFSWGPGITDTFRTIIQIDVYDDESLYVQEMWDRYMGKLANNAIVDVCFELDFEDSETVKLNYDEYVAVCNRALPLHMIKLSGPLIKHKPLAGNYVVAVTPYAKDGRTYDSFEALNEGEKEYVRKLKQKKKIRP